MRTLFLIILASLFYSTTSYAQYPPTNSSGQCPPHYIYYSYAGCVQDPNNPPPAANPSTKFFFATPGVLPGDVKLYATNTKTIDSAIAKVTGSQNVSRNLVDDGFREIDRLESRLAFAIKQALRNSPDIDEPGFVTVNAGDIKLSISQTQRMINITISGLSASALGIKSRKFCPVTCTRVRGSITFKDIAISTSYDFANGSISNSSIDFEPSFSFRANGLLGALNRIFNFVDLDKEVLNVLDDGQSQFSNTLNMQELFSVVDFLDSLRVYADDIARVNSRLPASLTLNPSDLSPLLNNIPVRTVSNPVSNADIMGLVNRVIDESIATVNGFGGLSLQTDFILMNGKNVGGENMIGLAVSHVPPTVTSASSANTVISVNAEIPSYTRSVSYFDADSRRRIYPNQAGQTANAIVAVGSSSLISGLNSFPSNRVVVHQSTPWWQYGSIR